MTLRKTPYNKENLPLTSSSKKKRDDGFKYTVDGLATIVYGSDMEKLKKNVAQASNRILLFFRHPLFKSEITSVAKATSSNVKYLKMVNDAVKDLQKASLRVVDDTFLDAIMIDESIEDIAKIICDNPSIDLVTLKLAVPTFFKILFKDFDYDTQVKEET